MTQNKARNVLTLPSVLFAVMGVGLTTFQVPLNNYFETGQFKPRSLQKATFYTVVALVASASARYSEDKDENLYTNHFIPGRNKYDTLAEIEKHEHDIDDGIY